MVEGRSAGIVLGVDQDELGTTRAGFVVEKSVGLFDPMRGDIGNVDQMSYIPREKPLRPLIIFQFPLPEDGRRNCQENECDDPWSRRSLHLTSVLAWRRHFRGTDGPRHKRPIVYTISTTC